MITVTKSILEIPKKKNEEPLYSAIKQFDEQIVRRVQVKSDLQKVSIQNALPAGCHTREKMSQQQVNSADDFNTGSKNNVRKVATPVLCISKLDR